MSDIDLLIQCPVCEQWRHKSWFDVGRRGCRQCQVDEVVSFEIAKAKVQVEEAMIPQAMLDIVAEETKPDSITASQWRMLHLLDYGYDTVALALATSIPSQDIPRRKQKAINALYREADRRANVNLGIETTQPQPLDQIDAPRTT